MRGLGGLEILAILARNSRFQLPGRVGLQQLRKTGLHEGSRLFLTTGSSVEPLNLNPKKPTSTKLQAKLEPATGPEPQYRDSRHDITHS